MDCREEVINSKILGKKFQALVNDFEKPYKSASLQTNLRRSEQNNLLVAFLSHISFLFQSKKCHHETFKMEVYKLRVIHLEVLWYLHICKVLSLAEYVSYQESHSNNDAVENITSTLLEDISIETTCDTLKQHMYADFLSVLFSKQVGKAESGSCVHSSLINKLAHQLCAPDCNFSVPAFLQILHSASLSKSDKQMLYCEVVKSVMRGIHVEPRELFLKQSKCVTKNKNLVEFFTDFFKHFTSDDVIMLINSVFMDNLKTLHWNNTLQFLSIYLNTHQNSFIFLKNFAAQLIEKAFCCFDTALLSAAFTIVRQCCRDNSDKFPSYLQWFSCTFSSESARPINSKQTCEFFMNFLSAMVDYDSAYYLKIHINRAPHVPIECQSLVSDYIKLVKTKLCDLNVSSELGFFENMSDRAAAEYDVETVVKHFAITKDIPQCVLQGSVICKLYYEKKFLTELLSKFEGKGSARHNVICKLQSLGKIPPSMYLNYKLLVN